MNDKNASITVLQMRTIFSHAWPILVAHIASIGAMIVDTILLGHYSALGLAAAAVADGIYITVLLTLSGILQAVAPVVAHLKGAQQTTHIAGALQQGFWLTLLLCIPGVLILVFPGFMLGLFSIQPELEAQVRIYLMITAWGLPLALLYRTFYFFCNAISNPKPLMLISLATTVLHLPLAAWLIFGGLGVPALGANGAAISVVITTTFAFGCGFFYLRRAPHLIALKLLQNWQWPRREPQRELMRLGLPMGLSNFVEISAFTLVALFLTPLNETVVAGHRIVASISAMWYMAPLSLAIAALAQVGQSAGARDWRKVRASIRAGMLLAGGLAVLLSLILWIFSKPIIKSFTDDPGVDAIALSLIGYVVAYQLFDAMQTLAGFSLRGMKISFTPMFLHMISFWGIGLGGGFYLAYYAATPMGAAGFWLAAVVGIIVAMCLLNTLLFFVLREREKRYPFAATPSSPVFSVMTFIRRYKLKK